MTQQQFNRSRFARIMSWGAFQALSEATHAKRNRLPYEIPMTGYFTQKRPARLLTKCTLEYIRAIGGHAEEVKTTGTMRKDRTGKMIWAYSQTMTGSADIHAVINGRFIAIEIKIGKDKQSEAQKLYQRKVEASGGKYYIIKELDGLLPVIAEMVNFENNKHLQKWD